MSACRPELDRPSVEPPGAWSVGIAPPLLFALLSLVLVPGRAAGGAADRTVVPGLMGYNALPTLRLEDPKVGEEVLLHMELAAQVSDLPRARDAALTPYLRLVVPFRGFAALEIDVVPVELWRVDPATQQRIGATRGSGTSLGDVRFGARFTIVEERAAFPALGLLIMTKSASGKSFEDRRFTDAPGYVADALAGKTFPWRLGPFDQLRALAKLGFTAWQQGTAWQDDALDYGATLQLRSANGSRLELEWRGYWGYERDDRPSLIGLTFGQLATRGLELAGTLNRGISSDAPPWEIRLGTIIHFDARSFP
jgi:hypothetical protein